jgi:putative endonuclease
MSFERKKLGASGEDSALEFLIKKHFLLVARNLRLHCGEIDLLMQDGQTLVIVEVKTKSNLTFGLPQEEVDWHKQYKLRQLAAALAQKFPQRDIRIDVVAVDESTNSIDHIVSAVEGV